MKLKSETYKGFKLLFKESQGSILGSIKSPHKFPKHIAFTIADTKYQALAKLKKMIDRVER